MSWAAQLWSQPASCSLWLEKSLWKNQSIISIWSWTVQLQIWKQWSLTEGYFVLGRLLHSSHSARAHGTFLVYQVLYSAPRAQNWINFLSFWGPWNFPHLRNFLGLRKEDRNHLSFYHLHPDLQEVLKDKREGVGKPLWEFALLGALSLALGMEFSYCLCLLLRSCF